MTSSRTVHLRICWQLASRTLGTNMEELMGLPNRCCFGVVEGIRALQLASSTYISCQPASSTGVVILTNSTLQLHDVYRKAQKPCGASAAKRQQKQRLSEERANKRQQLMPDAEGDGGIELALAAVAGSKPAAAGPSAQLPQQTKTQAAPQLQPSTAAALGSLQLAASAVPATLQSAAAGTPHPGSGSKSSKQIYTFEQLKAKTNKELVDLLRARSCPVSGQKTELIKRLLDYQRRLKKAQEPL